MKFERSASRPGGSVP